MNLLGLTPGITRRPKPLMYMRAVVSAVGCMPFLCKVNMQAALRGGIKRTQLTVVQAVF